VAIQSTTRTQLDQLRALSGFEAISKETISALERKCSRNTELQKNKTELELVETRTQNDYFKTNFEDLEKKPPFDFYRTKTKMDALQTEIDAFEIQTSRVCFNELGYATMIKAKKQLLLLKSKKAVEESKKANQIILDGLQQFDN
jgi:hypothetical protein